MCYLNEEILKIPMEKRVKEYRLIIWNFFKIYFQMRGDKIFKHSVRYEYS